MAEVRHVKKAVGFTGHTIKRWLATSPRTNDKQTQQMEDVVEPATPVRLNSGEIVDAPRKKSTVIDPSSLPSIQIEEPPTPSQSPKAVRLSSIDSNVATAPTGQTTAIDQEGAPIFQIEDPAILSVTFLFGEDIDVQRSYISLGSTTELLTDFLAGLCAEWRRKKSEYMQRLKGLGHGVHMVAYVAFEDHRDWYVSGDQHGRNRFETIRDYFENEELDFLTRTEELPVLPIGVSIGVMDLGGEEKPFVHPPPPSELHRHGHHLIAAWPLVPSHSRTQHNHLSVGLYARYDKHTGYISLLELPQRQIAPSLTIGDLANARPHIGNLPGPNFFVPPYKGLDLTNQTVHYMITRNIAHIVARQIPEPANTTPRLPMMTFNEYQRPDGVDTDAISNDPIHLAVRLVNAVPNLPRQIHLPANILMKVHPGKGTHNAIVAALTEHLWAYTRLHHSGNLGVEQLYTVTKDKDGVIHGDWGGHRVDLWVLPQGEGKGKERMYLFERGSLKWFLSGDGKETEDRRLYVEAWILPRGGRFGGAERRGSMEWRVEVEGESD